MLARMWRNEHSYITLQWYSHSKKRFDNFFKILICSYHSTKKSHFGAFIPEKWRHVHRETCTNIYVVSFVRALNWEQPRGPSVVEWLNKQTHAYCVGLLSNKKERSVNTCNSPDQSPENCTKWKNQTPKAYIFYDSDDTKFLKWYIIEVEK